LTIAEQHSAQTTGQVNTPIAVEVIDRPKVRVKRPNMDRSLRIRDVENLKACLVPGHKQQVSIDVRVVRTMGIDADARSIEGGFPHWIVWIVRRFNV
jgi:hypothetical protein